jgi:tetratricopeptide (TPR) repeat protein
MIGDAHNAIECFRKALYLEPYNSDVLINTARLLLKLQNYDDALYLTRKSLNYIRSNRLPWLQHATMAEIFKNNGFLEEAQLHLDFAMNLKPDYEKGIVFL